MQKVTRYPVTTSGRVVVEEDITSWILACMSSLKNISTNLEVTFDNIGIHFMIRCNGNQTGTHISWGDLESYQQIVDEVPYETYS